MKLEKIVNLKQKIASVTDNKIVYGEGNIDAKIMLIGEAPGAKEVELGKPFVGQAGKNLEEFLSILQIDREDIYITNVVKIRPYRINEKTGKKVNRPPNKKEIGIFRELLNEEIDIISPSLIVTLGNVALRAVAESDSLSIGDHHGKLMKHDNRKIFPLYHPAAIIYNQSLRGAYLQDLDKLKDIIKII